MIELRTNRGEKIKYDPTTLYSSWVMGQLSTPVPSGVTTETLLNPPVETQEEEVKEPPKLSYLESLKAEGFIMESF